MAKSHPIGSIKKGALHSQLGIPPNKPIPMSRLLMEKGHAKGVLAKRVNFAIAARSWNHTNKT
jgi:hypothetical protein